MKKVFFIAVLTMAGFVAQAQDKGGISVGVKAGPNFSTITGDLDNAGAKVGIHAGIFAEFMFTENVGLQPELLFSLVGTSSDYDYNYNNDNYYNYGEKLNLSYISLPIMVTYHFNGVRGLSAMVGPQVSFLMAAKYKYDGVYNEDDIPSTDVKDNLKTIDIGVAAGAQYAFPFKLVVGVRGIAGVSNIYDGPINGQNGETM